MSGHLKIRPTLSAGSFPGGRDPSDPEHGLDSPPGALRFGWRGLLLVAGFWALWGLLMGGSLLISPSLRAEMESPFQVIWFGLIGALVWTGITIQLFALTERLDLHGPRRVWSYATLIGLGVALAPLVSLVLPVLAALVLDEFTTGAYAGTDGYWRVVRYRLTHDLLAALLVLTAGIARHFFIRFQARQEETAMLRAQLSESRLEVLRAQLDPHFLFNTLNAVAALVASDPRGVRRMIARLSGLLRHTLEGSGEAEIPVSRELEMLERYLEILEIRFQGELETRIETGPGVMGAMVPNLILQPLAENAIKHGVEQSTGPGRIVVRIMRTGTDLELSVTDSGPGPPARNGEGNGSTGPLDAAGNESSSAGGFGLRHTRERLRERYGERAELTLRAAEGGGAVATIRLPFRTQRRRPELEHV